MSEELTRSQKYYLENKEKIIEYNKKYYQENLSDKKIYNLIFVSYFLFDSILDFSFVFAVLEEKQNKQD